MITKKNKGDINNIVRKDDNNLENKLFHFSHQNSKLIPTILNTILGSQAANKGGIQLFLPQD